MSIISSDNSNPFYIFYLRLSTLFIKWCQLILSWTFPYNPKYFAYWRIIFGSYLTFYSIVILPYVGLLYSNQGIYQNYSINTYIPNILSWSDSLIVVNSLAWLAVLASLCILIGWQRPYASLVMWYIQTCFLSRNIITEDPSMMFIGLLLILLVLIPQGEPFSVSKKETSWYMPYFVYYVALLAFGLGFTISAIHKMMSSSWQNGEAMYLLYDLTIVKNAWLVDLLSSLPEDVVHLQTWFVLGAMMLALPLVVFAKTRWLIWLIITGMFSVVLFVLELDQVVMGVLLYCFFIFDLRWYQKAHSIYQSFLLKIPK